jgi:hypothetical protein
MDTEKKTIQVKKVSSFLKLNFVPSAATVNISKDIVDEFIRVRNETSWTDFNHLIQSEASMWCIVTEDSNWKLGKCSCPFFSKNYKCKHLIAISSALKLDNCIIPQNAKNIPLGQKRKRGAPTKAKKALIVQ